MQEQCHEQHGRSVAKAISYRVVSIIVDLTLVFLITKRIDLTLGVVIASNTASVFVYYFHERVWNKIHIGRKPSR